MLIHELKPHYIDTVHWAFHGDSGIPCIADSMNRLHIELQNLGKTSDNELLIEAARYALLIAQIKPYGQDSDDTAIVTVLALLRLNGIWIEASNNHALYKELDSIRHEDYARVLAQFIKNPDWKNDARRGQPKSEEELLAGLAHQAHEIAKNYQINPLYGYIAPQRPGPSIDELVERDRREYLMRRQIWEHHRNR